ncbi:hypothetical protein EVAR_61052_1 [Eumeta japonica]|uniref:Uncharacterized protein n=1 Tax=Eumeta variegata TaxID=151549 RepID=A0A4C1Z704_EUMVA|nr:hypothetical protein EVAR_61052_1 [Eumeta japonica]
MFTHTVDIAEYARRTSQEAVGSGGPPAALEPRPGRGEPRLRKLTAIYKSCTVEAPTAAGRASRTALELEAVCGDTSGINFTKYSISFKPNESSQEGGGRSALAGGRHFAKDDKELNLNLPEFYEVFCLWSRFIPFVRMRRKNQKKVYGGLEAYTLSCGYLIYVCDSTRVGMESFPSRFVCADHDTDHVPDPDSDQII